MAGNQIGDTLSSQVDDSVRFADGAGRNVEVSQSDSSHSTLVDDHCGESSSAQAASCSTNDIVVSKGRNGCESDCVYNSDSETGSTRP